ncbi:MAG: Gfo/Idh/MocA family oxidoreductase [Thermoprotei archaeon]|nr:Gfo/Idh/MocA family oxidoreductase [Thermoprotei archaeon]
MCARYRAGIIGCGRIARMHLNGWRSLENVEVVAAMDINEAVVEDFCRKHGIPRAYTDYEEMVTKEELDLVSICTWPLSHAEITVNVAKLGVKGILCEKPMCLSLAEADSMIEACERNGVKLAIGHQHRFDPPNVLVRQLIARGAIGKPHLLVCRVEDGLLNNGTHYIDLMRYWLGDPKPEWVIGQVERKTDRFERGSPIEDLCMGLICFENGTRGLIESDLPSENFPSRPLIYGSNGIMTLTGDGVLVLNDGRKGWQMIKAHPQRDTEFSELIDWIEGRREHRCSARQARYTMEIMMAIYESARTRSLVRMPLKTKENPLFMMIRSGQLPIVKPGRYDIRLPKSMWKCLKAPWE